MKRNSKGFTLIELLAVVVILGILVVFSLPAITGVLNRSKNKVYVSDARKLISLAEYKIKANSSVIETPIDGDCIIITMQYLDAIDFDNPPNGGEYLKDSSFVVVKNDNGKLVYAATVVEKIKKGSYRGIQLTKQSTLLNRNSYNRVTNFEEDDLIKIEGDVHSLQIGYINEKIGSRFIESDGKISAVYHYNDLVDNSSNYVMTNVPKIVMANILSESDDYYNSLDAILQMQVDDKDNKRSELKVYLSLDDYDDTVIPEDYGDDDVFVHRFKFGKDGLGLQYNGDLIKIYIIVKDPQGNETKKTLTYRIHSNEAPAISKKSAVTRRDNDIYYGVPLNMTTAKVSLVVSDDIDDNSKLLVCIKESPKNENFKTCSDYRPFYKTANNNGYFSSENTMEYAFNNCEGGKCVRDGTTHYLTVFVKDTYGAISKMKFAYKFSMNEIPEIQTFTVESNGPACTNPHFECPIEEGASRRIFVNLTAKDDVDRPDQMSVRISDGIGSAVYNYANQPIEYYINGTYDGSTRTIQISVTDSEGGVSQISSSQYKLYKNQAPILHSFSISSHGVACLNSALCPEENGGSKTVNVYIDAEDDIDYDDLGVCFSIEKNKCSDYKTYRIYDNKPNTYTMPHDYDGSTQIVYAYVKDLYQMMDSKESEPYLLYTNQPPVLEYAVFNSVVGGRPATNSLHAILSISARDDVDTADTLRIQVIEDGVVTQNGLKLSDYMGKDKEIKLAGAHDGRQRNIEVKILDNDSGSDSKTMTYDVYEGRPPTIDLYNLYSNEVPCLNDIYCPVENNGHYNAKYRVKASDDIDIDSEIQVCLSESDTECDNYKSYSEYLDDNGVPKEMTFKVNADSETPYDGSTRTLYLYVKDSDQNVVKQSKTYKLYKNKKPVILENAKITRNVTGVDLNYPDITYTIDVEDDLDTDLQIAYCYKKDDEEDICTEYEEYHKSKVLDTVNFFDVYRPNGETFVIYSKIKDSYGEVTKSNELTYKLYTDSSPIIYQKNIVSGERLYKNASGTEVFTLEGIENPAGYSEYTRLKIKFSVDDPFDQFSVCVSKNSTTCGGYNDIYDANNCLDSTCTNIRKSYDITYDYPGFIEDGDNVQLYLFVRDSYDNVSSAVLYNGTYNECDDYNEEDAVYEYEFDSELTNSTYDHTNPITMVRCAGKCYYYNAADSTTNEIFAMYKSRITYSDKFNSGHTCNADNPTEVDYDASCSFKDCFYKDGSYERNAIGTRMVPDAEPWVATIGGTPYVCTGHYNLYLSSYKTGARDITLTLTNTKMCNTAVDSGVYDYDSTAADPYVRISD